MRAMPVIRALCRLLAAMILAAGVLAMAPPVAEAHAGHVHSDASIGEDLARRGNEAGSVDARDIVLSAPTSKLVPAACTTSCCAADSRCCAAVWAAIGEVGPPHARRGRRGVRIVAREGIDPAVPLKPPRGAGSGTGPHL